MTIFSTEHTAVLVDVGVGIKRFEKEISELGLNINKVSGILITHTHTDHVSGLPSLTSKYEIPIYTDSIIRKELIRVYKINPALIKETELEKGFKIDEFSIEGFKVAHDAPVTYGYNIIHHNEKTAVLTDIGHLTNNNLKAIEDCTNLILEANYNKELLALNTKLPRYIKDRIASNQGHLSNESSAKILQKVLKNNKLQKIGFAHRSQDNNSPDLIIDAVIDLLNINDISDIGLKSFQILSQERMVEL